MRQRIIGRVTYWAIENQRIYVENINKFILSIQKGNPNLESLIKSYRAAYGAQINLADLLSPKEDYFNQKRAILEDVLIRFMQGNHTLNDHEVHVLLS